MEKQERRAYRLMAIISSGNAVVDEVQKIVITGNIVSPVRQWEAGPSGNLHPFGYSVLV